MGLKMNAFGLMYNDKNTTSLGAGAEINIQTSNAGGKYHYITCKFCRAENKIPLSTIKQELEVKEKARINNLKDYSRSDEDRQMDRNKEHLLSFRCGRCNMPISTVKSLNSIDIYNTEEYHSEVKSIVESWQDKKNINRVSKRKIEEQYKEEFEKINDMRKKGILK